MRSSIYVILSLSAFARAVPSQQHARHRDADQQNVNHIFNTLHSSLRQWGSSLNHNGMTLFMASVPENVPLYHGAGKKEAVKGMEWLAFEPEHALLFANAGERPPGAPEGRTGGPGEGRQEHGKHGGGADGAWGNGFEGPQGPRQRPMGQRPMGEGSDDEVERGQLGRHHPPPAMDRFEHHGPSEHDQDPAFPHPPPPPPSSPPFNHHDPPAPPPSHPHKSPPHPPPPTHLKDQPNHRPPLAPYHTLPRRQSTPSNKTGYLHTYTPKHALKLLYIDGLSAGKSSNGTLDTQDILLLNNSIDSGGPMGGEVLRAEKLCNLSATLWQNKIDGVLRMEGGFEIILCDFAAHLDVVEIMPVQSRDAPGVDRGLRRGHWDYTKAVASRYHGLGGRRATLNYETFVSVFAYDTGKAEGMDIWTNDVVSDTRHPRLQKARDAQLQRIRDDVTGMILGSEGEVVGMGRNWQEVVDLVVTRYSASIHYLHNDRHVRRRKEAFSSHLFTLVKPFIAHSARNITAETARCARQHVPVFPLPPAAPPPLAHVAVHSVTAHICETLISACDITSTSLTSSRTTLPPSSALRMIDELADWLQWTTWKECGPCADEEVCVVPIWPTGSHEEHRSPKCTKEDGVGTGYWGSRGPPGGRRPGEGGPPGRGPPERHVGFKGKGKGGHGPRPAHGHGKIHWKSRHCGQGLAGVRYKVNQAVQWVVGWLRPWPRPRAGGYHQ